MKYLFRLMNFSIILSFCLMNMNCTKDYSLKYTDTFVAKINSISMNPTHIECIQQNGQIAAGGIGGTYKILFILPENLTEGKYPLSQTSAILCSMIVNGIDILVPDHGFLQFSRSDGLLNGSFTFDIDDNNDHYDVYGYFNIQIQVIED